MMSKQQRKLSKNATAHILTEGASDWTRPLKETGHKEDKADSEDKVDSGDSKVDSEDQGEVQETLETQLLS
jgi:hypothetical protein